MLIHINSDTCGMMPRAYQISPVFPARCRLVSTLTTGLFKRKMVMLDSLGLRFCAPTPSSKLSRFCTQTDIINLCGRYTRKCQVQFSPNGNILLMHSTTVSKPPKHLPRILSVCTFWLLVGSWFKHHNPLQVPSITLVQSSAFLSGSFRLFESTLRFALGISNGNN